MTNLPSKILRTEIPHQPLAVALSLIGSSSRSDVLSLSAQSADKWLLVCMCGVKRLNKCVNCDHLSRQDEPLVKVSAICLDVLTYLNWSPGSGFIRSNNQSRFTRWFGRHASWMGASLV